MKPKTYQADGFAAPQTLSGLTKLRFVKRNGGLVLQNRVAGTPRGEFTKDIWVDVPIISEGDSNDEAYILDVQPTVEQS